MRADRLLSVLLLLQTRGRMTAQQLAERLGVSERTIYRDLDALSMAGVPVYGEHGPGGGYALLESYRTNLTGLTETEARTLFFSGMSGPLADLGLAEAMEGALLKLAAALPLAQRETAEQMRQRIHLDAGGWFQPAEAVPHLHTLHEAVWQERVVRILYRASDSTVRERLVCPYGLVAKANVWYLVALRDSEMRVYRVSRIQESDLLPERFERPADFDLAAYWTSWVAAFESSRPRYQVRVRVGPGLESRLALLWGEHLRTRLSQASADGAGWREINLTFETFEAAQSSLLGLGPQVEVLEPPELRAALVAAAAEVVAFYGQRNL